MVVKLQIQGKIKVIKKKINQTKHLYINTFTTYNTVFPFVPYNDTVVMS